jgi:hypothetical protein
MSPTLVYFPSQIAFRKRSSDIFFMSLSLMFCTSDRLIRSCHWLYLLVIGMILPVTNHLAAISLFAVVAACFVPKLVDTSVTLSTHLPHFPLPLSLVSLSSSPLPKSYDWIEPPAVARPKSGRREAVEPSRSLASRPGKDTRGRSLRPATCRHRRRRRSRRCSRRPATCHQGGEGQGGPRSAAAPSLAAPIGLLHN